MALQRSQLSSMLEEVRRRQGRTTQPVQISGRNSPLAEAMRQAERDFAPRRNDMLEALDRAAEDMRRAQTRQATNAHAMRKYAAEAGNDPFAREAYTGAVINTRRAAENARDKTDDYLAKASRFDPTAVNARRQAVEQYDSYINNLRKAEPVHDSLNGRDSHAAMHGVFQGTGKNENPAADFYQKKRQDDLITQIKVIDKKLDAERRRKEVRDPVNKTLYKLSTEAKDENVRNEAKQAIGDTYTMIDNLQQQRLDLMDQLHQSGGAYGADDLAKSVHGAVWRGMSNIEDSAYRGLDFLNRMGAYAFGWTPEEYDNANTLTQQLVQHGMKNVELWNEYTKQHQGSSKAAEIGGQVISGTVAALPYSLMAIMSGGSSAALSAAEGISGAGATAAHLAAIGKAATTTGKIASAANSARIAVATMAQDPQYWFTVLQEIGSSYDKAKEDGAKEDRAVLYAVVNSLTNAMVEIGGGGIQELIPAKLRKGGEGAVREWVDSMIDEGKEEVVQGIMERGLQVLYGKRNEIASMSNPDAVFNPVTAAQEFGMGAAVGGILGSGQVAASSVINRQANQALNAIADAGMRAVDYETAVRDVKTKGFELDAKAMREAYDAGVRELEKTAQRLGIDTENMSAKQIRDAVENRFRNNEQESRQAENGTEPAGLSLPTIEEKPDVQISAGPSALASGKGLAYTLASNIPSLHDMEAVKSLTGTEMNDRTKKPSEQITAFFRKIGNIVHRDGLGDVVFGDYGVGGMINHRPLNRAKMVSLAAVPEVVQSGRQISHVENWKGRGYDSYVFAGPVTIAGKTAYVAAVVNRDQNNRFYMSEAVDSDGNYIRISESPSDSTKTGVTAQGGVTGGPDGLSSGIDADSASALADIAETSPDKQKISQPAQSVKPEETSALWTKAQAGTLDGWNNAYSNSAYAFLDALKSADPELYAAYRAENRTEQPSGKTKKPITNATNVLQEYIRAGSVSPMAAAKYLSERYHADNLSSIRKLSADDLADIIRIDEAHASMTQKAEAAPGQTSMFNGESFGDVVMQQLTGGAGMNTQNGGMTNAGSEIAGPQSAGAAGGRGTDVSGGGRGRVPAQRAGEQAGRQSGEARLRELAGQRQAAIDRRADAKDLRGVSASELGVDRGTEEQNLRVMPRGTWDAEMQNKAAEIKARTGYDVDYVLGSISFRQADGSIGKARAVITGQRILIQCDHNSLTVTQLGDHELYHALKQHAPGMNADMLARVRERYGETQLQKVLDRYVEKLNGVYDITERMTDQEYEAAMERIMEELLADAYAGINAFGANTSIFQDAVREGVNQYWGFTEETTEATERKTGPPEQYSLDEIKGEKEDYGVGVILDTDLFEGVSPRNWGKVLGKYVYENMAGAQMTMYDTDGIPETVELARINDRVRKDGAKNSHRVIDKLARYTGDNVRALATVHLSELLEISGNETSTNEHSHQWMDENGWTLRTAFIQDRSGNIYEATLNIANGRDRRILYDISNIRKIDRSATGGDVPSAQKGGARSTSHSASGDMIAEEKSEVKDIFSVDDEEEYIPQSSAEYAQIQKRSAKPETAKKQTKPVAKSKPIIAKQQLRQNLLGMFSIPDGRKAEIGKIIDFYADRIWKQGTLTQGDMDAFFDRMYEEGVMTVQADEYARAGRAAVAGGRVFVPERVKAEFKDDWAVFKKRAFAAGVYLTDDNTYRGADQWNEELAESFPGVFDADDYDERGILERIVDMAEEGKDQKMSLGEYAAMLAGQEYVSEDDILDNMERQMDWALRTFAEKAALEVRLRDRTGRKIAQEREKAARQMTRERAAETQRRAKERDRRKELSKRHAENRELRELQQKTLKQLQWLNKNRQKAPADLRAVWDDVLGDIDLYAVSAANEMRWSKKYNATWRDLADMYKAASENDPNFLPSKELQQIVDRLDKDKIADMDPSALADLYNAAVGLRTEFYNRNNVINDEEHRAFADLYTGIKDEMADVKGGYSDKAGSRFFNDMQLTPMNAMLRMAGWNKDSQFYSVARMLEQGERDMRRFTVNANAELAPFLEEHADWVKRADGQGKDAIWYELEVPELVELGMGDKPVFGKTVKVYMTPAQKVHMYLESKNYDNLRHMAGGRTFADKELYSKGKRREAFAQGTTVKLAPETVKKIVSDLTPEEMELARTLEHFYNETSRAEINRVSNALYGYDKAIGGSYAPIVTNQNYVKSEPGVFNLTAEGVGNLKAREYSKNPSYNISAFDAFERSTEQTARFVGMAIPARNVNTLMNWRESSDSMRDILTHKWGSQSTEMIDDLLTELQGGKEIKHPKLESFINAALSKYIQATFGFNPSIVMKQFASYPLAAAYLGYANMPKWVPGAAQVDAELIRKYSGELAYRQLGYATPETALLKDNPGKLQEKGPLNFAFGGGAITWMDGFTVRTLWTWAENKVKRETELRPGTKEQIDAGTDEYYKAVAKEFEEAVSRSQPMYDVMHRSTVMREGGGLGRAFTLFKTVPQQEYNMIREAFGELRYAKKSGADKATLKAAQQKAGRAVSGIMLGNLLIGMITFLNALWKNRAKKYRDDEGELTAESVIEQFGKQYFSDSAGVILGGDVLSDILSVLFTGDKWYDLDAPGIEQINEIIKTALNSGKAMQKLVKDSLEVWNNDGDWGKYMSDHGGEYVSAVDELVTALGKYAAGLPTENVKGYLLGALSWLSPKIMTAYEDVMSNADKDGLKGLTGDALELRIGHVLNEHGVRVNDETAAALGKLYEAGMKSAIPTDAPTSVTFNSEDHELNLAQQQTWNQVWSGTVSGAIDELTDTETFRNADSKMQAKMLDALYDYAAEKAKEALFDDYEAKNATRETERMMELGASMAEVIAARAIIAGEDKMAGKVEALRSSDLSDTAKGAAYYGILASDKEREMLDAMGAESAAANAALTNTMLAIRAADNDDTLKGAQKSGSKRDAIADSGLSDDQKAALYRRYISESRDDDIKAFKSAGLTFNQFLGAQNKYAEINEMDLSAGEKATEFSRWVNNQKFSKKQAEVIKDCFKYYSQVPQEAGRYEKLLNAGLSDKNAYDISKAIADLKPEAGKNSVSDMQKYRVIEESKLSVREKIAAIGTIMGTAMTTDAGNPSQYAKMKDLLDSGVSLSQFLDLSEADAVDGYLRYKTVSAGKDYGISPETYLDFIERLPRFDADGNGSFTQKEIEAALNSMSGQSLPKPNGSAGMLTRAQMAVLWQIANKSWKPKNNPYDVTVGQRIYDALHA